MIIFLLFIVSGSTNNGGEHVLCYSSTSKSGIPALPCDSEFTSRSINLLGCKALAQVEVSWIFYDFNEREGGSCCGGCSEFETSGLYNPYYGTLVQSSTSGICSDLCFMDMCTFTKKVYVADVCEECKGGHFLLNGSCHICPLGTFSVNGETCLPCAAGTYATRGASTCIPCAEGTFSSSAAYTCSPTCEAGYYCANKIKTACDAGTYSSTVNASDKLTCKTCTSGTYSSKGAVECTSTCGSGNWCSKDDSVRHSCDSGTYSSDTSASSISTCINCDDGFFNSVGSSTCGTPCGAGYWCSSGVRTICPEGTYSSSTTATTASECKACSSGTNSYAGSTSEALCLKNDKVEVQSYAFFSYKDVTSYIGGFSGAIGLVFLLSICCLCYYCRNRNNGRYKHLSLSRQEIDITPISKV